MGNTQHKSCDECGEIIRADRITVLSYQVLTVDRTLGKAPRVDSTRELCSIECLIAWAEGSYKGI